MVENYAETEKYSVNLRHRSYILELFRNASIFHMNTLRKIKIFLSTNTETIRHFLKVRFKKITVAITSRVRIARPWAVLAKQLINLTPTIEVPQALVVVQYAPDCDDYVCHPSLIDNW
jgi:hypothetical protein